MRLAEKGVRLLAFLLLILAYPAGDTAATELPENDGWYAWNVSDADDLRVFVRVRDGELRRIHTPRHDCWFKIDDEVTDLPSLTTCRATRWRQSPRTKAGRHSRR